ncbi:DNA recombination protein RmuC [Gallibacter intestinalis]|uniref:DNA recombination protein RmuC n=1 Tax=Gallibacter intestinalis TaxID=2779356 RepID=A0ABR9QW38_9FIRM|nr:DNA recombination protein RmuC [Gallibacter intestinalis]MBE5035093.1 DNA recombination protein RmuC [Gallibacter intestinalis]
MNTIALLLMALIIAVLAVVIINLVMTLNSRKETMSSLMSSIETMSRMLSENQKNSAMIQDKRLEDLAAKMDKMTAENIRQLDNIRETVDEKLQKTLEERITQSFKTVSDRLEQVHKGLGEMQTLASGVGDLKKVLSNVKTRGILGEIQLGSILEQILSPEQYEENVKTRASGNERVEFAVKMPGSGDDFVYLPIDAKFPGDTYEALMNAYETGDKALVDAASKNLENAVKKAAKDIHDKYIEPPYTTDFAIMFLPFEGLYAEVVKSGLTEKLQRDYKVNIAGPTTMAALLNSLQMGFKTLAIQKRSSEVWKVLAAAKTEFGKFQIVIEKTQQRLNQANEELDKLVGVRTRSINRTLKSISDMGDGEDSSKYLLDEE